MNLFVRGFNNYDVGEASDEAAISFVGEESLAKQSEAEDADINTIVRRFNLTGKLPDNVRMPLDVDFVGTFDFKSAMNAIREAEESFMEMPADVRARFHNDPHEFVQFCSDKNNLEEAVKLGLAPRPEVAPPAAPAAAAPPAAAPGAPVGAPSTGSS